MTTIVELKRLLDRRDAHSFMLEISGSRHTVYANGVNWRVRKNDVVLDVGVDVDRYDITTHQRAAPIRTRVARWLKADRDLRNKEVKIRIPGVYPQGVHTFSYYFSSGTVVLRAWPE